MTLPTPDTRGYGKPREETAKVIYYALPNFGMEWVSNTAGGYSQIRADDTWEQAPDRHEDCLRQADAVLTLLRSKGWLSDLGISAIEAERAMK